MAKFWMYFKKGVLIWGFICLAIVLVAINAILIDRMRSQKEVEKQEQVDTSFKKTDGDLSLKVTRDSENQDKLLISISNKGKSLVSGFELPTEQFMWDWIEIGDAKIFPIDEESYRVILFSGSSESDHDFSHRYIWVFTLKEQMRLNHFLSISDVHQVPGSESSFFGNLELYLPNSGEDASDVIYIPAEIHEGKTINTKPMLSQPNLQLIRQHYHKVIEDRISKLSGDKDVAMLEKFKAVLRDFDQSLVERRL